MRRRFGLAAVALGALLGSGCRLGTLTPEEMDQQYPLGRMQYLRKDRAEEALGAIKEKVGAPFKAAYLMVQTSGINVEVQDPRNPANGDTYVYSYGKLHAPQPIRDWSAPSSSLFPIEEADPARFAPLAKSAVAIANIQNGHVSSFVIRRSAQAPRLEAHVGVTGPRSSATVMLELKTGALVEKR